MQDLKQAFEHRRSINFFDKTKGLSDQILKDIINLAVQCPSAFNLQPWQIIAVKSEAAKQKLLPLAMNQQKVIEAPATLIIVGDRAGYEPANPAWTTMEEVAGKETVENSQKFAYSLYGSTEERKVKFAESNCGLLAMAIMYAAQYYGVESHAMNGVDFEGIKREFNLGPNQDVVMLIALGYFDQSKQLYPRLRRRGYSEIVKEV